MLTFQNKTSLDVGLHLPPEFSGSGLLRPTSDGYVLRVSVNTTGRQIIQDQVVGLLYCADFYLSVTHIFMVCLPSSRL